jgi:predicted lipoprotein with Yx(FWY)xxD motif
MVETSSSLGKVLADAKGKTLYTRVNDKPDGSGCTGGCLNVWPPLYSASVPTAPSGFTQPLALTTRADNSAKQVMVNNFPVYTFASDQNPGDTKGEGVGDPQTWHAVKVS